MLENVRIAWKLGLGYAVTVGVTVLVAIAGIAGINRVYDGLDEVANHRVPNLLLLFNLVRNVETVARSVRNVALADNDKEIQRNLKAIETAREKFTRDVETLEKSVETGKARALLQAIKEQHVKYLAEETKFEKFIQDDRKNEALALLREDLRLAQVEFRRRIDAMAKYQEDEVKDAAVAGNSTYQNSRRILWMVTLLVLLTSTAFAILTTRSITARVTEAMNITQSVAAGDLGKPVKSQSADELGRLLAALEKMRGDLANAVGTIRSGAYAVRDGAHEIAKGNSNLSSRTEQQASSLEETASTMEELTAAVKQNAQGTREVNHMAIDASGVATKGAQSVRDVVTTINEIAESSRKIADIISVIDSIAFQTNILALNAAVEAARAGEQGRGFAVVAAEVRNLAQRSATAAREIKVLIEDSVSRVDKGTTLANGAGKSMDDIIHAVSEVTKRMSGIASANEQQLSGIEQINNAVSQMEQMVQQSAALVEQSAAAAEHMAGQAESLSDSVSHFKLSDHQTQAYTTATTAPAGRSSLSAVKPSAPRRPERLSKTRTSAGLLAAHSTQNIPRRDADGEGEWKAF